jgi:DMSO reductase anchor subunit
MHPAYSVIIFTSASGAGYGLWVWLALARLGLVSSPLPLYAAIFAGLALVLVTTGLLASTFHLGHPERAWRAFSQWRSSWLSREGVLAVLTYPVALVVLAAWMWDEIPTSWVQLAAVLLVLFSLLTVLATGMIYASLKAIPRWNNGFVTPVYLLFSLSSGGLFYLLALNLSGMNGHGGAVLVLLVAAWLVKYQYWRFIDNEKPRSTTGTATGLGHLGEVRQLDAPHTSENYLLKEMGYVVARKHGKRLRRLALSLGLIVPAVFVLSAMALSAFPATLLLLLAAFCGFTGVLIERWLFFGEARHLVTLYYGRSL